jgi:hypothetical protein
MNVVASSGWLEYFNGGPNADYFKPVIKDEGRLIIRPFACMKYSRLPYRKQMRKKLYISWV